MDAYADVSADINTEAKYIAAADANAIPYSTNYRICSYKRTVKQLVVFRLQPVYFYRRLYKTYVVGTHLNCLDKSGQFKWILWSTCLSFIKLGDSFQNISW